MIGSMEDEDRSSSKQKQQQLGLDEEEDEEQEQSEIVMPGFRFHPTEEELVEFYLRRKVEGKRFSVELITFLDLYRYDPWELPAMAAIGEKEWYFYVPRDRKYRNGDRPNRVTTSGYWKATGADRMIRSEANSLRSIGLKKTLVFYSGKAPKGIRTSWIMNEYRLPLHDTQRLHKAEISLCRVYKRAGVEDHPTLPRCPSGRATSSKASHSSKNVHHTTTNSPAFLHGGSSSSNANKVGESSPSSSTDIGTTIALNSPNKNNPNFQNFNNPLLPSQLMSSSNIINHPAGDLDDQTMIFLQSKHNPPAVLSQPNCNSIFSTTMMMPASQQIDDLHKLVHSIQNYSTHHHQISTLPNIHHDQNHNPHQYSGLLQQFSAMQPPPLPPNISPTAAFQWDWTAMSETSKDFTNLFNRYSKECTG
ncbi:NAC domain-containing protein 35-like [Andrographis paniculata]|uniref:NAC domain-containing protein 35-like n=1 Tax=Andrographis paniculata TaxID=175694 RepID=UPI0021E7EF25|nr:NAC domain-containing protein 35-like [Andrographis paniculata]